MSIFFPISHNYLNIHILAIQLKESLSPNINNLESYMVYKKILTALDLGPQSLFIAQKTIQLASPIDATVFFLHVIEPPMTYTVDFSSHDEKIEKDQILSENSLKALCEKIDFPKSQGLTAIGKPQDEILKIASIEKCDLIVTGSHGIGGYTHQLGSTAHHIISYAHCDVMIVQVSHLQNQMQPSPNTNFLWDNTISQAVNSKIKPRVQMPPHGGSLHGFGENVSRGPRLVYRPSGFPYKGGHKTKDDKDPTSDG